jgi:eukaryotic-like serine/threonine-protein kinase
MSALDTLRARLGDRYLIERELGRGGMGTVYLARDVRLERPVALKVLPAEFAAMPALRERFLRETRTAAGFSHPNIVPVYAVEEGEDFLAYAMAYVEGESLADRVKRAGPLGVRETVKLLQDAGYALAYAHGRGVVHRDIKPDNIMIERATGRAMVMDFGIARVIAAPMPSAAEGLTRVGEVVGTPEFMSPEQATGDRVDGRSDLYSLGLTAHFAVTGRAPITGETTGKLLARQITEPLPPILAARPDLPAPLAAAIDRSSAKDPADRFQTAEELVESLDVARLAGPEIPLAIRMFAQEASSLSLVLVFGGIVVAWMLHMQATSTNDDILLPVFLAVSVLFTRVMQTMREAGRLAASGFSAGDVERGLRAVVTEREQRRSELRADEATRRARRRTLFTALTELVAAVLLFRLGLLHRTLRPDGGYRVDWIGTILVFTSMILLGVSLALLLRSPFQMPLGERLFRLVWLGPIGRTFVRVSGRRLWKPGAAHAATPPPAVQRAASLEARVAELERWRRESSSR